MKSSPLGENTEICCLIPNVSTNTINAMYYIKIIAYPDDLLAKKIELKMNVDFYSKDENQSNKNIYDNFNSRVKKINSGDFDINYTEPYLQNQFINYSDKRLSQTVFKNQNTLDNPQGEFYSPNNQYYEQNNYNQFSKKYLF